MSKISLRPEDLQVASFATRSTIEAESLAAPDSKYPVCIVYVTDCVPCPEGDAGVNW